MLNLVFGQIANLHPVLSRLTERNEPLVCFDELLVALKEVSVAVGADALADLNLPVRPHILGVYL